MADPGLTIHHLQVSQSERIPWLCEELNIPYNLQLHQRSPLLSPPDLASLHPMKAAPVITDATFDQDRPLLLAESAAICEYIIHKHGNGRLALPPSHQDYTDYLYWFHFANSGLQATLGRMMVAFGLVQDPIDPRLGMSKERHARALQHVDDRLRGNTWLAGEEFTAADIMTVFSLTTMRKFLPYELTGYDAILKYLERVRQREAYQRAMEKGDPDLNLDETMGAGKPELFEGIKLAMQQQNK